jgi:hypothetical protein
MRELAESDAFMGRNRFSLRRHVGERFPAHLCDAV